MLAKLAGGLLALIALAIGGPLLWYAVVPGDPPPDLPPRGVRVLAAGLGLNVVPAGEGPAAVLVHGLPGSAYDWRELQPELSARGIRSFAYDRAGYGHSDARSDGAYSVTSNARELVGVLEGLDLRDVTVVGWSYGGVTAMTAAAHAPERIGRVVLVGTGGPDSDEARPPEPNLAMQMLYSEPVLRYRRAVPPLGVGLMKVLSAVAFSDGPQPDWWLDGLRANFSRWDTVLTYRGEIFGFEGDELDFGFAAPVLLLHGDDDRLAPVGIARYLQTRLPRAELVEFPGASHMLPVTHAAEVADRIAAFAGAGTP